MNRRSLMGLLNNDNYIDPFKGADYIDPGKNAEKLSSNVDREHAQREAYEQQRYAKQQQTPQRTPTPPQEPRHTPQQALVNRQTPISRTTRTRKSRIPIIIIAIAVLTIIAMNLVGTICYFRQAITSRMEYSYRNRVGTIKAIYKQRCF